MSQKWSERCLELGRSVLVASVDSKGVPACCRGYAVRVAEELATVTAFVPVATSREVIANIASTRKLAMAITAPISHDSVQLKGTAVNVRLAREDEEPFVERSLNAWSEILDDIGLPRRIARTINHWPAFAIEMKVEQVFDQTPGPRAGTPMS